jgi:hypothetical protein
MKGMEGNGERAMEPWTPRTGSCAMTLAEGKTPGVVWVAGVGARAGLGAAVARRFAKEGLVAAVARRHRRRLLAPCPPLEVQ